MDTNCDAGSAGEITMRSGGGRETMPDRSTLRSWERVVAVDGPCRLVAHGIEYTAMRMHEAGDPFGATSGTVRSRHFIGAFASDAAAVDKWHEGLRKGWW